MKDAIVEKIKTHLAGGVRTESRVVYLLAEVRKLLDADEKANPGQPRTLPALWMFCHWALHVDLSNPGTTSSFMSDVEAYVISQNITGLPKPDGTFSFIDQHKFSQELQRLTNFRAQLKEFLRSKNLSTRLCDNKRSWSAFLTAYAGVIEDGSLSIRTKESNNPLKVVKKVTFTKGRALSSNYDLPFTIQWDIHIKHESFSIVRLELKSTPGLPEEANGFFRGLTLIRAPIVPPVEPPQP